MNMKWEWSWLPDGDPADTRLQEYYGLLEFGKRYELIWPSSVPFKLRMSLARDQFSEEDVSEDWVIVKWRFHEPYIFQIFKGETEIVPFYPMDIDPDTNEAVDLINFTD